MCFKIRNFLYGLLYEQNEPSLTRVIIASAFLLFIMGTIVDIILAVYNIRWQDYGTFASITGGGALAGKVGDKIVNTFTAQRYGSPDGQMAPRIVKNPKDTSESGNNTASAG